MKSTLFRVFAVLMVVCMLVTPVSASTPEAAKAADGTTGKYTAETLTVVYNEVEGAVGPARYIVQLTDAPTASYRGGVAGLEATNPAFRGEEKLNAKSAAVSAYKAYLADKQAAALTAAETLLGHSVKVNFRYDTAFNGISVVLSPEEAAKVAGMEGVKAVFRVTVETPDTDAGPEWIGAASIWDGETASGVATKGEGIIAGIIDTGINFDHPAFADPGPVDGYDFPAPAGGYLGVCDPTNTAQYQASYICNDKLIGAYSYTTYDPEVEGYSPEDFGGHGSHTASTTAGNVVLANAAIGITTSGVAPHAQVISYDVCDETPPNGACYGDSSVAAIDQAIEDGVDVINYSISGGNSPYTDATELAFLTAVDAGIYVSTSAGNSGPTAATVGHRSPWVFTTAASTHNRVFVNSAENLVRSSDGATLPELVGRGYTNPLTTASPIVFAGNYGNPLCLMTTEGGVWTPGTDFTGKIVLCNRGTNARVDKARSVAALGAAGFILGNTSAAQSIVGDTYVIPGVLLAVTEADQLRAWLGTGSGHTGTIAGATADLTPANGDIMASFSSRGPNNALDVLKPEISAPGSDILAALNTNPYEGFVPGGQNGDDPEYDFMSGTSMASPHNTGSGALMTALHPTWSTPEIKSAIMLTSHEDMLKEDGVTPADPFDRGAGRIDLTLASLTGLVLDETTANFEAANPAEGGDVRTLNLASYYNSGCVGDCTFTRTFKSVAAVPATYTFVSDVPAGMTVTATPNEFTIAPGATQAVEFHVNVGGSTLNTWTFGTIGFTTEDTHPGEGGENLLAESFETAVPPTGWAEFMDDAGAGWDYGTSGSTGSRGVAYDGTYFAWHNDYNGSGDAWLVSPSIAIPAGGATLSFYERNHWSDDYYEYHGVLASTGSCDPADAAFTELATFETVNETWTQQMVSLDDYAGQSVCFAFKYTGDYMDEWYLDKVSVDSIAAGADISDVHIPLAVNPTSGNLPSTISADAMRANGLYTYPDVQTTAITDFSSVIYGLAPATLHNFNLAEDSTTGSAYDNLSEVFYTTFVVPAGTKRIVAEVLESTSSDLDMFWGRDTNADGLPSSSEQIGSSATGAVLEYLSMMDPTAATYWVVVQNFTASGATDSVKLGVGVVPSTDSTNLVLVAPETNPAGGYFDLGLHYTGLTENTAYYGAFAIGTDPEHATNVGTAAVNIYRLVDDVTKTANVESAEAGDTITYTITVAANSSPEALTYAITDTLPAGVTYVPGSVTGGATYDEGTNTIAWNGTQNGASTYAYVPTTSAESADCGMGAIINVADANPADAYLDWKTTSYAFSASSSISGDSFFYSTFSTYPAFNFYGTDYTGLKFTADGFALFGASVGATPGANQAIPTAGDPNAIMPMLWRDWVVTYDAATNKGVSMVGDGATAATLEYDDVALKSDPTQTMDMEIGFLLQPDSAPGAYEIVYAFDNINVDFAASPVGTIGVENADGTAGTQVAYNDSFLDSITNGSAICFNWEPVASPAHVITYQVTVDEDAPAMIVNQAHHTSSAAMAVEEIAEAMVDIVNELPVATNDSYSTAEDTPLNIEAPGVLGNDTDANSDSLTAIKVTDTAHGMLTLNANGSFTYTPDANWYGVDSFTYKANDGDADSNVATVTITVADTPDTKYLYLPLINR